MLKYFLFILIIFVIVPEVALGQGAKGLAASKVSKAAKPSFYKIRYITQKGDTFAWILKKFVRLDSVITNETPMVQKIINGNPNVKDWANLSTGTTINIYISPGFIDIAKFKQYKSKMLKKIAMAKKKATKKKKEREQKVNSGVKMSAFYMASYGKFSQGNPTLADITFLQNSPATLGITFSYYPLSSKWSYSASLYLSYLLAAGNNIDTNNVSIPPEIGSTFYAEYRFKNISGYFGLDFERFTTFNLGGVLDQRRIFLDENKVLYFTLGVSKVITMFGKKFLSKLSIAQSVASGQTASSEGTDLQESFDGTKILFYLNKKINKKWFAHSLFKYHFMESDKQTELTTLRIGIGAGYILN
jgi:hypothetical protein